MTNQNVTVIEITSEENSLLDWALVGMQTANNADNQQLARQDGCYGGFYQAFHAVLTAAMFRALENNRQSKVDYNRLVEVHRAIGRNGSFNPVGDIGENETLIEYLNYFTLNIDAYVMFAVK